ncbi:hypothetical protein PQR39_25835 [Paraburkholderia sediminicola]|uniref:hypothetical protein n=1 Tax=Paraburkholderia sediminicola TaxID=458836 RepID=UPI0038B7898F
MQTHTLTTPSVVPFLSLPDGQSIEVEFDSDENAVEISLVESCGAVAGFVFIPVDRVPELINQLQRELILQTGCSKAPAEQA